VGNIANLHAKDAAAMVAKRLEIAQRLGLLEDAE
jgi:hypothetical protein